MDLLLILKPFVDWRALVDIVLMAAGLFFLYRTLQRLGTWSIAVGILVAMVAYLLASLLDLKGIEWIFDNLSQVAVIALIIIFQPELRKIFERAASVRRSQRVGADDNLAEILTESLYKLADRREGALVVLPGRDPLAEWLQGGHTLDARPSTPLIMSIFDHNSPGHDGALIVSRGKCDRFGVRLPISQSARLPEEYGTRHHAGMGLAERSDALVIVVSEERGTLTIFQNGRMKPIRSRSDLTAAIVRHWKELASLTPRMPEDLTRRHALAQVAVSLGLAVFFWSTLVITQGEILQKVLTVPVEFTSAPPHLVLVGERERTIQLHLSGSKSDLDDLKPASLSAKIDLSKAVAGKQVFGLTADNLRLPRNINLLEIVPSGIELQLAEIVEQEVRIQPQLVGKLPNNLKILSMEIIPARVKVLSPRIGRQHIPINVITTPVYLESIAGDTSIFCKVIAPAAAQPANGSWPDVEVVIKVSK